MNKPENNSIKNWAEDDRPREKLALKGKDILSNSELLAIIIGSGSKNKSALTLAQEILEYCYHDLAELNRLGLEQLKKFKGIGNAKAIHILAALELGNRRIYTETKNRKSSIRSSADSYEHLRYYLQDESVEESCVMYLNRANYVLHIGKVSKGGISNTIIDPRMIFARALELKATAIVLAHNHPSGNLNPSQADKDLTLKIKQAGIHMDINLLDHLIITQNSYFSFADEGLL
ncbi:MAG: DNA repair protein RadC [Saprospiraceae bacterium]|nr:DNA repair protein RadC [Saprospiraceae bacterium]